jgi:hypothetical protein
MIYAEKYGRSGQDTDENLNTALSFMYWINKATDTHSEYAILLFHINTGYSNANQCYVYTYIARLF